MSEVKSPITLTTGAAVSAKRLVQLSSGEAIHNIATTTPIGVADYAAADGDNVAVRLLSEAGTLEVTASGVISLDADVFAAADGKVSALPTAAGEYTLVGIAMEAATADGDIIEILPKGIGETSVVNVALTTTAPAITPGSVVTIDSGSNAVDATLADDTVIGRLTVMVMSDASNSSTVSIAHHVTSDPEVATFDAVDEVLVLMWTGTEYATIHATATFT